MSKQALFSVTIGGLNVTANFSPYLISLSTTDNVGTDSDTANITLDDKDGQLFLPKTGDPVIIALGWSGEGVRPVFIGTLDKPRSVGGSSGRTLSLTAKGFATKEKPKEPQKRHMDDVTFEDAIKKAGEHAGIKKFTIDPKIANQQIKYLEMKDESLIHFGERLAREYGGNFRIKGDEIEVSARDGTYTSFITAKWGLNLHSWDIEPSIGRAQFGKARARYYDREKAEWMEEAEEIANDAVAEHVARFHQSDSDKAKAKAGSDKATSERDSGGGSVVIEGNNAVIPDGLCVLSGARPGIDGSYRVETVNHNLGSSGWITNLTLKQPQGGAGTDGR